MPATEVPGTWPRRGHAGRPGCWQAQVVHYVPAERALPLALPATGSALKLPVTWRCTCRAVECKMEAAFQIALQAAGAGCMVLRCVVSPLDRGFRVLTFIGAFKLDCSSVREFPG